MCFMSIKSINNRLFKERYNRLLKTGKYTDVECIIKANKFAINTQHKFFKGVKDDNK